MRELAVARRLLRLAQPYWLHCVGLLALGLLASPIVLLTPVPLKMVVDSVLGTRPLPPFLEALLPGRGPAPAGILASAVGMLVIVTLLGQIQALASRVLRTYVGQRLALDVRGRLFDLVQRLSLSHHDARGPVDSIERIREDAPAIHRIIVDGAIPFVSAVVTLVAVIVVIAGLDWQLALVTLAVVPIVFLLSRVYRAKLRDHARRLQQLDRSALALVQETMSGSRAEAAPEQEPVEKERFLSGLSDGMAARIRLTVLGGGFRLLIGLVMVLGVAAVLLIGVRHVSAGTLSLGELLMVLSYLALLYGFMKRISRKAAGLQSEVAGVERVFRLLDQFPSVPERPDARPVDRAVGMLEFRSVAFSVPGSDRPILRGFSCEVQPGRRLGVVGASGADKTILINMLARFNDPTQGQILLDGVDLRDYRLDDLRRQLAVVPQDPILLSASIADNIACARPGATRLEVVAAAQSANAHGFIDRLPRGYDTEVGDGRVQITGGQRRRIALARAFLKNSPVLILHEPTSPFDPEADAAIQSAIRRLMRNRTVILVTHRAALLEGCTSLLVLEDGRVVTTAGERQGERSSVVVPALDVPAGASRLMHHAAAAAWCQLHPQAEPVGITPLQVRRQKNMVYRLEGVGRGGGAVIAKRCPKSVAAVERIVYDEIVSRIPIPSLQYYGALDEPNSEYAWLFIEEATGIEYSNLLAEHRAQAARLLAHLHAVSVEAATVARLPDAGPLRYLQVLQAVRQMTERHVDNPVLSSDDVVFLNELTARLDDLESQWSRVQEICAGAPRTLVHGDFNGKNLRFRSDENGTAILVFDWEHAGWGVPAVDLAQLAVPSGRLAANPDIPTYWLAVRERWPGATLESVLRLASCGTVCRTLSALSWDAMNLGYDWAHSFVQAMRGYAAELDAALERLDWGHRPAPPRREVVVP